MFIPLRHPLHNLNLTIRAPSKAWDHDCVCLYMFIFPTSYFSLVY